MSEAKGEKKGCKKSRRSSHEVQRHRSKRRGSGAGRSDFAFISREQRILARAIMRVPDGRTLDRMADQGLQWDSDTGKFLRDRIQNIMET